MLARRQRGNRPAFIEVNGLDGIDEVVDAQARRGAPQQMGETYGVKVVGIIHWPRVILVADLLGRPMGVGRPFLQRDGFVPVNAGAPQQPIGQ